jgi:hypothetical protein
MMTFQSRPHRQRVMNGVVREFERVRAAVVIGSIRLSSVNVAFNPLNEALLYTKGTYRNIKK